MDPLTHTLTGLALSRAGFHRRTPYATPILVLAALAPDSDIVTLAGGTTSYLHYHRHLTHSLVLIPVMAGLALLAVRLFARKPLCWKWAWGAALTGVASHALLDWTNSYGVRFFLPFSSDWIHLDINNLFDLWIWGALSLGVLGPLLARLVSSEIGARPGSGRGLALFALSFFALYDFGRWLAHQRALAILDSRLYQNTAPVRVAAFPNAVNPFRWCGLAETPEFYSLHEMDLTGEFDPAAGRVLFKPEFSGSEQAAWNAARQTAPFRVFLEFSAYPLRRVRPAEGRENTLLVEVMDLRFGAPPEPRFVAAAEVLEDGRVLDARFEYEPRQGTRAR